MNRDVDTLVEEGVFEFHAGPVFANIVKLSPRPSDCHYLSWAFT